MKRKAGVYSAYRSRVCVSLHERFQAAFLIICLRIFSDMEGDGDLMKMLMRADPPDESIQGPMDESALVQSGVRCELFVDFAAPVIFACLLHAHVRVCGIIRSLRV